MDKLTELVIECLNRGVLIEGVTLNEDSKLEYMLSGFSKSGTGGLTTDADNNIILKTRYDRVDIIETFEDIAYIAKEWQSYNPSLYNLPKCYDISY